MKDVWERLVELVQTDKELHDALVRLIHAKAEEHELRSARLRTRTRNVRKAFGGTPEGQT